MFQDTRTHVVVELYETEKSYVEALQTIVTVNHSFIIPYEWLTLNLLIKIT